MKLKNAFLLALLAVAGLVSPAAAQTTVEKFEKVEISSTATDALKVSGSVHVGDGTAANPARTYVSDTDLGGYRIGANNEGHSAGGVLRWDYNTTRILTTIPIYHADGSGGAPAVTFGTDATKGIYSSGSNQVGFSIAGSQRAYIDGDGLNITTSNNGNGLRLSHDNNSKIAFGTSADTVIRRDGAADTLALQRGTAAQLLNIYNTTDGTNKEYVELGWQAIANRFIIRTNTVGTGTDRNITIRGASANLENNSGLGLTIAATSGNAIFSGDVAVGTNPAATGAVRLPNNKTIKWRNAANSADLSAIFVDASNNLSLGTGVNDIQWGKALVALGGGAAPTLGTIGGSGPATATQNSWMRVIDSTGAAFWVPAWK